MSTPILKFVSSTGNTISNLNFNTLFTGEERIGNQIKLWNNKDGASVVDTAVNVRLFIINALGGKEDRVIKEGFVLAKSSGIDNPDLIANFFDDDQVIFTPLTDVNDLLIGDIPNNSARIIFFKVKLPTDAALSGFTLQFGAGHGSNVTPLPFFFNRVFGDGVVQEKQLRYVFPSVPTVIINTYSAVAFLGGSYIGDITKEYIVEIVAGGTPGIATFKSSDDGEASFSITQVTGGDAFTNLLTSADVDEGIDIAWFTSVRLETGDKWKVLAETRPFQFKAGQTNSLEGFIGAGTAFVANNRVIQNQSSIITSLPASTQTFIFLGVDGSFTNILNDPTPQDGKILMGWFKTDAVGVIEAEELFPIITLGLDLFDSFTPMFTEGAGLTFSFNQGRFRKFNEVIKIPLTDPIGDVSLIAGLTNYIQVDPITEQIITSDFGYLPDHIPLFKVKTGPQFIESFEDDRAEVGVGLLGSAITFTTSFVSPGLTTEFDFTGFINRGIITRTIITPSASGTGFTVSFYERDTKQFDETEYRVVSLPNPFTDKIQWFHHDKDNTKELHGIIDNVSAVTQMFTLDLIFDRLA